MRATGLVALLVSGLLVATSAAAFANYHTTSGSSGPDPTPSGDVVVEGSDDGGDDVVLPGSTVTRTLSGLPPWTDVHVLVQLNPVLFDGTVRTNGQGVARFSFTIPADAPSGFAVNIAASGPGIDGTFTTVLQGAGDPAATTLAATIADTGAEAGQLVLIGLAIAGLGIVALMLGRRREHARASIGSDARVRA